MKAFTRDQKSLKTEMALFEATKQMGENLKMLFDALKNIGEHKQMQKNTNIFSNSKAIRVYSLLSF